MTTALPPDLFLARSEEQQLLRDSCRDVVDRELSVGWVRRGIGSPGEWDRGCWKLIRDLGWTGLPVPEEFGGLGLGLVEVSILAEELGRAVHPGPLLASAAVTLALRRLGSQQQQRTWLPRLADGTNVGSWSVDVDGACGAVVADPAMDGADGLVLRGTRYFVPAADQADLLLLDVSLAGTQRLVVVRGDAPGLGVRRMTTVDLCRSYCALELDAVRVDAAGILDPADPPGGAPELLAALGTTIQCAESLGAAGRLVEMTVEYVKQRQQFGRPIGSFQAIKHRLADMRIHLASSTVATRYAAWAVSMDRPDAGRAVHVAKQSVGESCSWIASEALQLHGGVAFTWEHDLHLYLRRLKGNELTLGSPDWHAHALGTWRLATASN